MAKFNVFFTVNGTAVVQVDAASAEEAKQVAADDYAGGNISICHQCSSEISDVSYGEAVDVTEVDDE